MQFNIKDDTNKQHKHDLFYFGRCSSTNFTDIYIGETARRLSERVMDHAIHVIVMIVRHGLNSNHETVNIENFKFLSMGYSSNTYKMRIPEALFVKQYHHSLNMQDNSFKLILIVYL